jgi:hypothetical protein
MIDPFATPSENTAPEVDKPAITTDKPEGGKSGLSITYKGNNIDPWIVAYADSVDDALAIASDPRMPELMKQVRKGSDFFVSTGKGSAAPSASPGANAPQGGSQSPARGNPPGVPVVACAHGNRNYVSKANWAALFCGAPQGTPDDQKCEPLWRDKSGNFKER